MFSFGKKDALAEDKNIAQESKDEGADGGETAEGEAEPEKQQEEEEQADKQAEGDKKEGSKMSAGIRKFFSMGKREKEGEAKQEEAATTEENKDEEAKAADAERKSSPEAKHRQRSKSPHKKFPFEIKFGKKKEKSESDLKEKEAQNVEVAQTSEGEAKEAEVQQSETAAAADVQTESAAVSQEPEDKEVKEAEEVQETITEEQIETKVSTSTQQESAPTQETSEEPAAAAATTSSEAGLPAEAGQETATEDKDQPVTETQSTPASDAGKPAARGRRFPFGFMFGRRSERAKSADRTSAAKTEDAGIAEGEEQPETVNKVIETSASVPDVHLHATNYDDNQPAEQDKPKSDEAAETAEETSSKTKESHVHRGIKWPQFGGKKTQKQEEPKEKEAVDANETAESRQTADDSQLSADDKESSTPKGKKSLLGKGIFRIFSPRRDLQKSLTMDADDREGVISYSVEGEGQIMAADTEWRSKTASLDSKGRIPKSSTTGADRTEMVAVVADSVTDTDKCDVDDAAVSSHLVVVAIDFGTTYSGYAFSFAHDARSAAMQIHMMRRWEGGDPGVVNQKTPTTILLTPSRQFHSFGFTARDFYHDLDQAEANKWLYFEKFKMNLHYCAVSDLSDLFHI